MPECSGVMGEEFEPVSLQPFLHQVGGHTGMLKVDDFTVCKPFIAREHSFYLNVPQNLKPFTAEFRGVIEVELQEDTEGYVTLIGYVPLSSEWQRSQKSENMSSSSSEHSSCSSEQDRKEGSHHSLRLLRSGSIEVNGQTEKDSTSGLNTDNINPWSLKCHKKQLSLMRKSSQGSQSCKFILLENVAAQFCYPCILDLKMGTRQHGDDVSEAKKERFIKKCQNTTSSSLGVRICGMQVHQANTGKYICENKYYGRSLKVDGFKQAIQQFLHNGYKLRKDLLEPIINKLQELYKHVQSHDTYRFYSCSLLVMYDGKIDDSQTDDKACAQPKQVDVRMIDFAHSTHRGFQDDKTIHSGPDHGYLFGLKNLIDVFSEMR